MSGKNFMSFGDADTILTEFSNDIKSRVSTKANQGLTAQQQANAKTNIGIENVPNVATNDQTPTFLEESTRTNIASGDKLSLIFGKIKKFFSDLKTVAFTGSYNDLSDKIVFDNTPTQNSNNAVKSGGIFSTMAVPRYDSANRREYYEGGSAFSGNIDSVPTAGSNNAVASGGTYTQLLSKQDASSLVPIPFTVAITSAITTIGLLDQNCYYIPATNEVRIQVMIYSANGDIPSDNKVILTIPNDYKPSEVKRFMCMLGDTSNQPVRAERGYVELSGTVKLNNFIYGNKAINWIFFNFSYIK